MYRVIAIKPIYGTTRDSLFVASYKHKLTACCMALLLSIRGYETRISKNKGRKTYD